MRRIIIFCVAVAATQIGQSVMAADSLGRYAANYPATLGCDKLTEADRDAPELYAVAAFAEGWLSAHAKLTPGTFDFTPWQSIEYVVAQLRAYCAANPDAQVLNALDQLTSFLAPDALKEGGPPRTVTNGEQLIMLHPELLDRIRAELKAQGFAKEGDEDPMSGLKDFQRNESLPDSGMPDERTLQRLFKK
jgi:hypothetical protein